MSIATGPHEQMPAERLRLDAYRRIAGATSAVLPESGPLRVAPGSC
jgi:hypothetical protein